MAADEVTQLIQVQLGATDDEFQARWESEARREFYRWRKQPDACRFCGERIGHFGGAPGRAACELLPLNVPLEEVRPNCYTVRRVWIGDAIRAACDKRAV